jgi:hypothetical protein
MKRIIVILFLTVMFSISAPGENLLTLRIKHNIEFSTVIKKRENDEEYIMKKVVLWGKLHELKFRIEAINTNNYYFNSS